MKNKFIQLKKFNWSLFVALCALALIPAIYQTVKTFIITSNSSGGMFDIIGQMEWFDLINETLQAFLIIPLYSILNKIYKNSEKDFSKYAFKTGFITFIVYTLGFTFYKDTNAKEWKAAPHKESFMKLFKKLKQLVKRSWRLI